MYVMERSPPKKDFTIESSPLHFVQTAKSASYSLWVLSGNRRKNSAMSNDRELVARLGIFETAYHASGLLESRGNHTGN
jgi:hypothetical protein